MLHYLKQLMKEVLLPKERKLILLRCGMWIKKPMDFGSLAAYLHLGTSEIAEQCYDEAIQKTRDAISGTELGELILSYDPAE